MPRPATPLRDAQFPIDLVASIDNVEKITQVRWRDSSGKVGQSSIGAIIRLVVAGAVVTAAGEMTSVVTIGKLRFLVVGSTDAPIRKLPRW